MPGPITPTSKHCSCLGCCLSVSPIVMLKSERLFFEPAISDYHFKKMKA